MGAQLVALGLIGAPHGLHGELRVKLHNPRSELLGAQRRVWLRFVAGQRPDRLAEVRSCKRSGAEYLLVALQGVEDRDAAAELRGAELCVPRAELPQLADGEYYLIDLIGLRVVLSDGTAVGTVEEALEYPAAQVVRVQTADGAFELPLRAPYLVEVAMDRGEVVADEIGDLERLPANAKATR